MFARLIDANLTLNLAKCDFGWATVTCLGRQVGQGQVRPVKAKMSVILSCPIPSTRKALCCLLGMARYHFCPNFATVVHPLTNLLSSKVEFVWTPECQHAFDSVKLLLTHAPVLGAPDFIKLFKLDVDASGGAEAVLFQTDENGVDRPVSCVSKKFSAHRAKYLTMEK